MTAFVTMIDATHENVGKIPAGAIMVAGYVTGTPDIQWTVADWERFPRSGKVRISEGSTDPRIADVYAVEARALTIAQAVEIAAKRTAMRWNTDIYIDAADVVSLTMALAAAKIPPGSITPAGARIWLADWALDELEAVAKLGTTYAGYPVMAVQWASPRYNPRTLLPGTLLTLTEAPADLSVALPTWFPYVAPAPVPAWQLAALEQAKAINVQITGLGSAMDKLEVLLEAHQ